MATITLRSTKGSTLTHAEVDGNFTNLNNEKIQTSAAHAANDYAKFSTTANTVVGRSYSEVKTDLSLNNVENTALSTWAGSSSITTLGTISSGTWQGSAISTTYISNLSGTNTGDEPAASTTAAGVVELATTAETTTGTDTTRAVTPDGLKDGYKGSTNVITLGTITSGTWNGSVIASAYLDSDTAHLSGAQTFTGAKTFSGGLVASGGISGLDINNGISGTNFNITGVNQLEIADPGEGFVFKAGASGDMTLAIVDDTSDNILRYSGTGAVFDVQGNITLTGTVDGRDVATDGTKLDGIEDNATADQTQADINALAITQVGTISSGTWQGSVIASAYLDSDTAHLSGAQTFSGAKTFNGGIVLTSTGTPTPAITFNTSSGSDTGVDMAIRAAGEGLDFYEPEDTNKVHMRIVDDIGVNAVYGLRTGSGDGTMRIDASGNATLAACDADAYQEALTVTTGGTYAVSCNTGVHWRILNAACTISFTNTPASNTTRTITLIFQQDATGGRVITWPTSNWYWAENVEPPFDTSANAKNVVTVMVVNASGTIHYYASLGIRNAS